MFVTQACADKWKSFGNSCYLFVIPPLYPVSKWETAHSYCLNKSADLISLTTQDEVNFVFQHTNKTAYRFWIGLKYKRTKKKNNTTWMWNNGDKLKFDKWGPGEPNLLHKEHCGEILKSSEYWNNIPCRVKRAWICEKTKKEANIDQTGELKTDFFFYLAKIISVILVTIAIKCNSRFYFTILKHQAPHAAWYIWLNTFHQQLLTFSFFFHVRTCTHGKVKI